MANGKSGKCPFCSISVSPGVMTCPNCGGFIPEDQDDERPSGAPGGRYQPTPLPNVPSSTGPGGGTWGRSSPPRGPAPYLGSGFRGGSSYGTPPPYVPSMAPMPAARPGHTTRNVVIGVVVALALVVIALGFTVYLAVSHSDDFRDLGSGPGANPVPITPNQPVPGSLTRDDPTRSYEFTITQPGMVVISVVGDFDNYLELYQGSDTVPILEDDDSGGSLNATISSMLSPGRYVVLVRPYSEGTTGSFTLTVNAPAESSGMGGTPPPVPGPSVGPPVEDQTRTGAVASVNGPAPASVGDQCVIQLEHATTSNGLNCRIRVTCGGGIIYGRDGDTLRYGYNQCVVTGPPGGPAVIEAHDRGYSTEDGDPRIDFQSASGQLTVTDQQPNGSVWSVTVRFTSPAVPDAPRTAI